MSHSATTIVSWFIRRKLAWDRALVSYHESCGISQIKEKVFGIWYFFSTSIISSRIAFNLLAIISTWSIESESKISQRIFVNDPPYYLNIHHPAPWATEAPSLPLHLVEVTNIWYSRKEKPLKYCIFISIAIHSYTELTCGLVFRQSYHFICIQYYSTPRNVLHCDWANSSFKNVRIGTENSKEIWLGCPSSLSHSQQNSYPP
jgi:hypothetical protein